VVEVIVMIAFGIAGFFMRKADLDPAPLVLAFVLGNILETNFRQALLVGRGGLSLFYTRPIAATLLICCAGLIAWQVWKVMAKRKTPPP
jgi:putative tricarboxylic transport membrane protein